MAENYFTEAHEKWIECRRGRFTASEISKLFKTGRREMTEEELEARPKGPKGGLLDKRTTVEVMFGEGALSYIEKKANELTSTLSKEEKEESLSELRQMEYGKNNEMFGVQEFTKVTKLQVIYHGVACPQFYELNEFAGGSPDGDVIGESAALEMKCPYNGQIHMRRLRIKTIEEFKEKYFDDYCQCQMNMYVMKKDFCYYCSYDPRKMNHKARLKIFKIPADAGWVAEFEARFDAALEILREMLDSYDKTLFVK